MTSIVPSWFIAIGTIITAITASIVLVSNAKVNRHNKLFDQSSEIAAWNIKANYLKR